MIISVTRIWLIVLFFFVTSGCQTLTNDSDQKALRRQCGIPNFAKLKDFDGFPTMSGFGQREGLNLTAKFIVPKERVITFEKFLKEKSSEWSPLPIPDAILDRIMLPLSGVNLRATQGFFRCKLAGSNVLHERYTTSCLTPKSWVMFKDNPPRELRKGVSLGPIDYFPDIILSVYESDKQMISAGIASRY